MCRSRNTMNTTLTATTAIETALSTPTTPTVSAPIATKNNSDQGLPAGTASSSRVTALVTMCLLRCGQQSVPYSAQRGDRCVLVLLGHLLLVPGRPDA